MVARRFREATLCQSSSRPVPSRCYGLWLRPHLQQGCVRSPAQPRLTARPQHAPRAERGTGGESRGRAPFSLPSGRSGSVQQARVSRQAGVAAPPGRRPRTGAQRQLRSPGAFFLGRGCVASLVCGGPRPERCTSFLRDPCCVSGSERSCQEESPVRSQPGRVSPAVILSFGPVGPQRGHGL
ncbi:hypothetical protein NDU88_006504 [Pleurodeles waltl]|uniref:Uncharacterized protein n=1 Tax=Pleurodeles waltl TaxID=8319 RepID=A0AAV7NUL2_PLEWA|nr:hypothetical protein NDU88_006504 [Pleurodeles waltl]